MCSGLKSISWSQSGCEVIINQQSLFDSRLGYHWFLLFEREYLSLIWSLMEQRRVWLALLRLKGEQTGLHRQFAAGLFDVGEQVRGGGITGTPVVPVVPVVAVRPVLQVSRGRIWGYKALSNCKSDIRSALAPLRHWCFLFLFALLQLSAFSIIVQSIVNKYFCCCVYVLKSENLCLFMCIFKLWCYTAPCWSQWRHAAHAQ